MKTSNLFAAILLSMVFPLFALAQHDHGRASQEKSKSDKMSEIAPEAHQPLAEMSSRMKDTMRHEMMGRGKTEEEMSDVSGKGMKHDYEGKDEKGMMGTMLSGTHHIMVTLNDEKASKPAEAASAEVELLSPSKKGETTKLVEMMSHFGRGIELEEKGLYTLTVRWKVGDNEHKTTFTYQNN